MTTAPYAFLNEVVPLCSLYSLVRAGCETTLTNHIEESKQKIAQNCMSTNQRSTKTTSISQQAYCLVISPKFEKVNELTIIVNCNSHTLIHSLHSAFTRHASIAKRRYQHWWCIISECCLSGPSYSRRTVNNQDNFIFTIYL